MKNLLNFTILFILGLFLILGCSGANQNATTPTNSASVKTVPANTTAAPAAPTEKPIVVQARVMTKDYDENELAADGKYKGKMITVSGKIENIAETMGNVTVSLAGHDMVKSVMCSFEESEKTNVAKLKKGQQATLVGIGDGMTMGLYAGLQKCKVQ
ncbi:MAG: OB-fold putative lipoprotein [Pyrinomonadaceae bacterium]|nr:OB-fold putative lipoprotein [Pyrinomonadaceae bacterium]